MAAASEDFASGCLFKVPETGKGKAEADAFIEDRADAAEVDGEELLAEEPECAVPENVQEPDEQELLRALMEEQLVATAKAAEQAPAASSCSGTAAQPTDKKRATYRRTAAAGLLRKPSANCLLGELQHLLAPQPDHANFRAERPKNSTPAERSSEQPHTPQQQQQ